MPRALSLKWLRRRIYRARFRKGPVGLWCTRLGGGFEITHGCNVQFAPDGTGFYYSWGGLDEDSAAEVAFRWRSVGDRRLAVSSPEQAGEEIVEYDFLVRRNEYGIVEVCIFEPGHWGAGILGEAGFWVSAYPLAHARSAK